MRHHASGFTLLETLIGVAVLALVVPLIHRTLSTSSRACYSTMTQQSLQENARWAMEEMASELRAADVNTLVVTVQGGSSRVDFCTAAGFDASTSLPLLSATAYYAYAPSSRSGVGSIVRVQGSTSLTLVRYVPVGGLSITQSGKYLVLSLTLQATDVDGRPLTATVATSVTARNSS